MDEAELRRRVAERMKNKPGTKTSYYTYTHMHSVTVRFTDKRSVEWTLDDGRSADALLTTEVVPYCDSAFPAEPKSLYATGEPKPGMRDNNAIMAGRGCLTRVGIIAVEQWLRPQEFAEPVEPVVFDMIDPSDIRQGGLGDCWFLSAVAGAMLPQCVVVLCSVAHHAYSAGAQ